MQYDRQSGSPSKISSFSPTPAESVPSLACLKPCDNACPDIVRQLLDELISAAALQAAGEQQAAPSHEVQLQKGSSYDDSSRASGSRRSAITALREGIDARCDEPASIEAMEALDSTADDDLLVPSPFHSVPQHKGTTLQVGCGQILHQQQGLCLDEHKQSNPKLTRTLGTFHSADSVLQASAC
jgi:hypothetical protein